MSEPYLSIILPVHKDFAVFKSAEQNILSFFQSFPDKVEVLGLDAITGIEKAKGEFIFLIDKEISVPLVDVLVFLSEFRDSDTDIIIGDRYAVQSKIFHRRTYREKTMNEILNWTIKKKYRLPFQDPLCPLLGLRHASMKKLLSGVRVVNPSNSSMLSVEILVRAVKLNYKVKTFPVRWINKHSKLDFMKTLWNLVLMPKDFQ